MAAFSFVCFLAAFLFWTASALVIVMLATRKNEQRDWSREVYEALDPDLIEQQWQFRLDEKALFYASGFVNGFFWIFFCVPLLEMAWILSKNGTRAIGCSVGIAIFAVGGALTEWISHLFWVGMATTSFLLAKNFNLDEWLRVDLAAQLGVDEDDGLGWRTLEVNHITGSGMLWIISSFEWLALTGVFLCTFVSVVGWRKEEQTSFGPRWNALGLFIGLLAILEFAAEIVRFEGFKFSGPIVILYAAINRLILIPAWIISLGYQLPQARKKALESANITVGADLSLTEVVPAQAPAASTASKRPSNFTICDDDDDDDDKTAVTGPSSPPAEAFAVAPPPMMTEAAAPAAATSET